MHYNDLSGRSTQALQALSDGVFAVAMTLLVLDVHVPVEEVSSDAQLWSEMLRLGPTLAAYALSFSMLGTFWLAQHTLLDMLAHTDRMLSWLQLLYLGFVALLPFSASVLAELVDLRLAIVLYWANTALLGLMLALSCRHIGRTGLVSRDGREGLALFQRRILVAQVGYAAAAALCVVSPLLSVAAFALVQLYFITSPRFRRVPADAAAPPRRHRRPTGQGDR